MSTSTIVSTMERLPREAACVDCQFHGRSSAAVGYRGRLPLCGVHLQAAPLPQPAAPAVRAAVTEPAAESQGGKRRARPSARARAKEMLASGMSVTATAAATGLSRTTVSKVRRELPGLPRANAGGASQHGRALAEEITGRVQDLVAERADGAQAAYLARNKWTVAPKVMRMDEVPGVGKVSAYDDAVAELKKTPAGNVLRLEYANPEIAETYRDGIAKRAARQGLKVQSRLMGAVLYCSLKEQA